MFGKRFDLLRRRWLTAAASIMVTQALPALEVARMQLPDEFAVAATRLPAKGYGGLNRGQFAVGLHRGEFTRIESRFAAFDPLYAANRGKSSFTLDAAGDGPAVTAECRFKERVITAGVITFDATKLAYVCGIEGGASGTLTLGEPKPDGFKARVLARAERRGLAEIGAVRIDIASVHQFAKSRLSSQVPVGYLLSRDAEIVGAVELTDSNPTFFFRRGLPSEVERATLIAALGLSVLRDPAVSMLGD